MLNRIPFSYRITVLYIFFGALWILFSDKMVIYMTDDLHQIQLLSTYKGWLYVLVTGILLYFLVRKEIRRRTLIYNELLEAKHKAEVSDSLKTTFLSNLSHYVRTPMNGILGFVQLLEDRDISPEKHQFFLSYINELSQHLLRTLNSIIEISRIQTGQVDLKIETFSSREIIEKASEIVEYELQHLSKPVVVIKSYHIDEEHVDITSDKEKMIEVFVNLLSNAVNFTEKGNVEIGCSNNESEWLFWVRDTGKGVDPERIDSLFDSPLQNASATIRKGEGAGFGLPLSAGLVKLFGGRIWLEPLGNAGSKFCFTVPFCR